MVDKETYLKVLKEEKIKLLTEFYKPKEEGTGHFNTAASVLQFRIEQLENQGKPTAVHLVVAIACTAGIEYVQRLAPHAHIWCGDIDEELTAKSYIVPGLGDAGDLAFGTKIQH